MLCYNVSVQSHHADAVMKGTHSGVPVHHVRRVLDITLHDGIVRQPRALASAMQYLQTPEMSLAHVCEGS